MSKLSRITGKVFGASATATGEDPQIGQFGSALAGTYNGTTDIATIQSLPAWQNGFIGCVTPNTQFPPLPEMTGFGKVLSHQICYLLQQGIAEWDNGTTYYENNWCAYNGKLYISKTDENLNNLPTDTTNWEQFTGGFSRNYGEIVTSSLPISDPTLHLADGSLLSQTDYPELLSYISSIYVAPTTVTYYAWRETQFTPFRTCYTLSATPQSGDNVYFYSNGKMTIGDTVEYIGTGQSGSYIQINSVTERFYRYSNYDENITVFSQSFFTTEANWQTSYTTYGECGKYVYNSSTNTVRIPAVNSYFTNTANPQKLGDLTEASLPNIKGTFNHETTGGTATGAFSIGSSIAGENAAPGGDTDHLIEFNAGTYNSIYKDSATTVNTQSIKQLVYIVVAK